MGLQRTIIATSCVLLCVLCSEAHAQLRSQLHASGFSAPVAFVQDPTNPNVQFVVQQGGQIRVVQNGSVLPDPFLSLPASEFSCCGERGLLGLAFAPDYSSSRRFFVNFTNPAGHTVVARFKRSAGNPHVADPASRFDLVWASIGGLPYIPHVPAYGNHNGGDLAFGPDGFLYVGMGDGGSGNDPNNRAQDPGQLLGKMLRVDVKVPDGNSNGYQVPADNPFLDGSPISALPEIWAFGLRNPWRFSFDDVALGGTGALLIADVGQNAYEEVDFEPRGAGGRNYGWRYREGAHDNVTTLLPAYPQLIDPIHEYGRSEGQSISGGFVYRGSALGAGYRGRYFFADFIAGRIWSFALNQAGAGSISNLHDHTSELGALGNISAFGVDAVGELYVVSYSQGSIFKILPRLPLPAAPTGLRIVQ